MYKIYFAFLLVIVLFTASMCKKDNSYDPDKIDGPWRCEEASGMYPGRNYDVSVSFYSAGQQDSTYLFHNLYNMGFDTDVYFKIHNNSITISGQMINGAFVSGTGTVSTDKKHINLEYQIDNEGIDNVVAVLRRPN